MLIDVHAHLDDAAYDEDREQVIKEIKDKGMIVVNSASDLPTIASTFELAQNNDFVYATLGVHPYEAAQVNDKELDKMAQLLSHPKVIGVGEIGLDYHMENFDKKLQQKAFIDQLELANEYRMPVVVHDRDAHGDTMDILKKHMKVTGIMHCFSGSYEMARQCLDMGMYISIGGVLTFKNARKTVEVIEKVPLERILTETDCPYLTPEPYRGTRNKPVYVKYVVQKIAEIKGVECEEVERIVYQNVKRVFPKVR